MIVQVRPEIPVECVEVDRDGEAGPRVFVFGCARSGTTLLANMFRGFNVQVMDDECCLGQLTADTRTGWLVGKRTAHCAQHLLHDLDRLRGTWIVDIIRDPRDVVTSKLAPWPGFYCEFDRWQRDVEVIDAAAARYERVLRVRYEDLVTDSGRVQSDLADRLGLTVIAPFDRFPQLLPEHFPAKAVDALGGVRAVAGDRIGRWQRSPESVARVIEQLARFPQMEQSLRDHGYPATVLST